MTACSSTSPLAAYFKFMSVAVNPCRRQPRHSTRDARVVRERQRLDPLFVGAQIRDGGVRFEHLPAPLNADLLARIAPLLSRRANWRCPTSTSTAPAPCSSAGDVDDGLIEQCQRVAALS